MSNRFPALAAPAPSLLAAPREGVMLRLPLWTRSFPLGEILMLTALGLLFALA